MPGWTPAGAAALAVPVALAGPGISPTGIVVVTGTTLIVAAAAVAWWRRGQQLASQRRNSFARRLLDLDEAGRKRLACAIQDGLGHQLLRLKHEAELGLGYTTADDKAQEHFTRISALASDSLEQARGIASRLRPFELDQLPFNQALAALIAQVAGHADLRVYQELADLGAVSAEVKVHLYRIAESLLENVVQHSRASTVCLELKLQDRLVVLQLEDDGVGFPSCHASSSEGAGWGLRIAEERAKLLGGTFHLESASGKGTRVLVTLPLD